MNDYPPDWPQIALRIKEAAGGKCERCGHAHDPAAGYCLTVHHLDGIKSNCADWNLASLCQRCHLRIQGRVKMDQLFFLELLPISGWFKPHYEGYLKSLSGSPSAPFHEPHPEPTSPRSNPTELGCDGVVVPRRFHQPSYE